MSSDMKPGTVRGSISLYLFSWGLCRHGAAQCGWKFKRGKDSYIYIIMYQWLDFYCFFRLIFWKGIQKQTFNASSASAGEVRFQKYLKKSVKAIYVKQKWLSVGDWAGSKLWTMSKAPKPQGIFRGAFTLQALFPCLRWPDQMIVPTSVISKQHIKSDPFRKDFGAFYIWLKMR